MTTGSGLRDGFAVERWLTRAGDRSIAIAEPGPGRGRCLVSWLPWAPGLDAVGVRTERAPWDLPLVDLAVVDDGTGLRLVEALPAGEPSSFAAPDPAGSVPRFAAQLAVLVAAAHASGVVVGPLHPALVFVAADGSLAGTSQRPLRAPLPPLGEGRPPLFEPRYLVPADLGNDPETMADDTFRLAAMAWAWRHGESPFGSGAAEVMGLVSGHPGRAPADDLDRLLVAALAPDPARRPSAAELATALGEARA